MSVKEYLAIIKDYADGLEKQYEARAELWRLTNQKHFTDWFSMASGAAQVGYFINSALEQLEESEPTEPKS